MVKRKTKKKPAKRKTPSTKRKSGQSKLGGYGRKVLKATTRQTGKSNLKRDRARKAMQPGKRRSASGRTYTETRKNRSDRKGSRV